MPNSTQQSLTIMSRWKASSIHLAISASVAAAMLALMLLLWYPYPLFEALGGQKVLLILICVDITLGPLVTLLIFNMHKSRKALAFDLSVIAILQLSALIYGMGIVFQARPVYVVFIKDSFDLVTAQMLSEEDLSKAKNPEYRSLPLTGPIYVYSEMPTDIKERNEVVTNVFSGKDLPQYPQFYMPYEEHKGAARQAAKPLATLRKLNPNHIADIDNAIQAIGRSESDIGFLPLRAKYQDQAVLVGIDDGTVLKILPIAPWPPSGIFDRDKK